MNGQTLRRLVVAILAILLLGATALLVHEEPARTGALRGTPAPAAQEPPALPGVEALGPAESRPRRTPRHRRSASADAVGEPTPTLEVLVTDGGVPVEGALVRVLPQTAIRSRRAREFQQPAAPLHEGRTGVHGSVALPSSEPWRGRVVAVSGARAGASADVRFEGTDPLWLEVRLVDAVPARGRVVAAGDRPIAGAQISVALVGPVIPMGTRIGVGWTATTDASGAFDLGWLPIPGPEEAFVVLVRGRGFADLDAELSLEELRNEPTTVRVVGWVRVRGILRDPTGRSVSGATVKLRGEVVTTEADGTFDLRSVGDGESVLHIAGARVRHARYDVGPFPRKENDLGVLRAEAAGRFVGRVVDEHGAAVSGAIVQAQRRDAVHRFVETGSDGRFEVYDTSGDPHDLQVLPPRERRAELMGNTLIAPPRAGSELTVVLPPTATSLDWTLRVRLEPGARTDGRRGPERVTVALQRIGSGPAWGMRSAYHVGEERDIALSCPGPGTYRVTAHADAREPAETEVRIGPRGGEEVELTLGASR